MLIPNTDIDAQPLRSSRDQFKTRRKILNPLFLPTPEHERPVRARVEFVCIVIVYLNPCLLRLSYCFVANIDYTFTLVTHSVSKVLPSAVALLACRWNIADSPVICNLQPLDTGHNRNPHLLRPWT